MTIAEKSKSSRPIVDDKESNFLSPLVSESKELISEQRTRKKAYVEKSIHLADVPEEQNQGWEVRRYGKRTAWVRRTKSHDKWLEDRVWCLLRLMGYQVLNGTNFKISFCRADGSVGKKQVDVYAEDEETAFVVECKSRSERGRRSLQKDIQETISLQSHFRTSINNRFAKNGKKKPKIIWIYATSNILWSTPDIERAIDGDIRIITGERASVL